MEVEEIVKIGLEILAGLVLIVVIWFVIRSLRKPKLTSLGLSDKK